jgi:hypothetical protein
LHRIRSFVERQSVFPSMATTPVLSARIFAGEIGHESDRGEQSKQPRDGIMAERAARQFQRST